MLAPKKNKWNSRTQVKRGGREGDSMGVAFENNPFDALEVIEEEQ